ncbi:hypothetical protein L6Q21_06660 [Sandaracinobacter sp. RS1-74]|uniref:hypothetical protein n=1 Tax=Sandaracinobacteroides sayramensis TaxID=2913411 RepID=UPI001EDAC606|nr:hypothetical protein [Sandaracinobacteroides sayramensis]MCG2840655.1 hypothetical protein [Sandaracinobacteroides sayramensis]
MMAKQQAERDGKNFTLGLSRFASISAVEGIYLSEEAKQEFLADDRRRATPAERRQRIIAKYAAKA